MITPTMSHGFFITTHQHRQTIQGCEESNLAWASVRECHPRPR
jgi:hypothetical protein